jgi:hypothetical protein
MDKNDHLMEAAISVFRSAAKILVFTGAGMSSRVGREVNPLPLVKPDVRISRIRLS